MREHGLSPRLTPQGHLLLASATGAPPLAAALEQRLVDSFARGAGHGLLQLGASEVGTALPAAFSYWREFGARYVTALCATPPPIPAPAAADLVAFATSAPPMEGAEYLSAAVLGSLWAQLNAAFNVELEQSRQSLPEFLKQRNPAWNLIGRVHFNLAENRSDEEAPFAFIATYTTRLSAHARAQHVPLAQALEEYSGAKNKDRLLSLLLPVQRAAHSCEWVRAMIEAGEIYHPLRWSPAQALQFLSDGSRLEAAGIVIRAPGSWRAGRPSRPQVKASVGAEVPSLLGREALLDFDVQVTLDGERLSGDDIRQLLAGADGLQWLRGRWVEIDREKLGRMLGHFREVEKLAAGGLPFAEAMRLVAGASILDAGTTDSVDTEWSQVVAGPWLAQTLQGLRSPEGAGPHCTRR